MPIPETPMTRSEQYLNAIATSDTSNIPDVPMTREEQYLDYIARNGGGGGGGSSTLSGLTDVDISNPSDGQTLVYNASAGKWENGSGGGGGTPDMIILTTDYTGMWTGATYSIIAGSYSALRAKLVAHNPAVVCLCVEQSGDGFSAYTEYVPFFVTLGVGAEEDYYIGMKFTDESFVAFALNAFPDGTVSAGT